VSTAIPDSALRLVRSSFDGAIVASALAHAEAGRVHLVKPPPWPVVARVRADAGYVVTVGFNPAGTQLRGECSCPVAHDCDHAAAAALVALAGEQDHASARLGAVREAAVGEWLVELGRVEDLAVAAGEPAASNREVAYVLDDRDGVIGLSCVQTTRLKDGGVGVGPVIGALGDRQRGAPAWVPTEDLRRIGMLRALARVAPNVTKLPLDRVHDEMLRELVASGRTYWGTPRGAPLSLGPEVEEPLRWLPEGPELSRLGLESARVLVPARRCYYVEPAAARIGPLEVGVPAALVARLVAGPPVPHAMRATVERSLRALIGPPPARIAAGSGPVASEVEVVEPWRPRLEVGLEPTDRTLQLIGEAVYGDDERFPLAVWQAGRPRARDLLAEGRARQRLDALVAGLSSLGRPGRNVALLNDARTIAETIVPTLRAEGWECVLSDDFPRQAPRTDVSFVERLRPLKEPGDWFGFELGVTVAGRTIPLLPVLLDAIKDGQLVLEPGGQAGHGGAGLNLRLPEGELVHVPADRVRRWLQPLVELALRGLDPEGAVRLPASVALAALDGEPGAPSLHGGVLDDARARVAALLALAPRTERAGFGGELRPYQRLGLAWLHALHAAGSGGLLADEMGLGKTVQLLAWLLGLAADGSLAAAPALVVAPRSVVGNWAQEAARFAGALDVRVHLGADRATTPAELGAARLVLTSYQTLVRDLELFRALRWTTIVFDEAQVLKNPDTQLRTAAAGLGATSRFAVTGTPLENHLGELWSIADLAAPGLLGPRRGFDAVFRRPIEKHAAAAPLEELRRRLAPIMLRRTKASVELELPPRTEIVERVDLDVAQRDLYESLRLTLDGEVRAALARRGIHGSSMLILDALLTLRQCCCDPRLVRRPEARRVRSSGKLERLMDMLAELAASGRSTLVFSQFTSMLALIERACTAAGISNVKLTGTTRDREEVVRRFQAGEARVFLISLKAGGTGLNLTRADTVIHYDPWWNPAAERQATDRAHRIGQDKPVMVYKLVARGTLEEAICTLQDDKRQLSDAALKDGGLGELAGADLEALYRRLV
jgi:superfamily II DNA or RNA helicase